MQYKCVMASQVELPVAEVKTRTSDGPRMLLLTTTCLGVVLLMVLACSSLKFAMTSRYHGYVSDIISVTGQ